MEEKHTKKIERDQTEILKMKYLNNQIKNWNKSIISKQDLAEE